MTEVRELALISDQGKTQPPGYGTDSAGLLRDLFGRPGHIRIVGAHNPLGARLAERAGFDGVWSSGLEISASHGVPDADILTMTELLAVARSMAMAVDIPVVADCDAGYGNATNVMHMIRQYEAAGIAAVSIEDKPFPKMNSFIPGRQELVPVDEFAGKIAAAKAAQRHPDLMVIARIEALIAGLGMAEALRRGEAYAEAGADAVLIHAKGTSPEPILEFLRQWRPPVPVVAVPTTYHTITADQLLQAGAKMVIYANQGLRASIKAVSDTFAAILREGRSSGVEESIAPLATVFDLQGMARLIKDESRYLRPAGEPARALVVAGASSSPGAPADRTLTGGTADRRQIEHLRQARVQSVTVATGDAVDADTDVAVADPDWTDPAAGFPADFAGRTLVLADDVLVEAAPLRLLLAETADIVILVDVGRDGPHRPDSLPVTLSPASAEGRRLSGDSAPQVSAVGGNAAEFAGAVAVSAKGFAALREAAVRRRASRAGDPGLPELVSDLIAEGSPVFAVRIVDGWTELRAPDYAHVSAAQSQGSPQ